MKHVHRLVAAMAVSLSAAAAGAATPVALLTPVAFAPTTDPRAEVRDDCKLGDMLAHHVGDALRRANKGPGTTDSMQGDVLKVTVTTIWGARGNNWTGPKGLGLDAVLLHDGVVVRSTSLHRTTMGGFWGAFKGICGFMERDSVSIGRDLARWSRDPKFVPPSEDAVAPEAASAPASEAAN
ncbi:hypothetical protein [Scleromatobacter humisilvae]|uniref:Lipoprotein n=1 Tax=Scleromatobacter humisilvae TaxID=2897159 RepID=A0A9X1YDR3_9BURK|nr:hypothetical protein [Scleromatobacter humisilvae]MCK9684284.1 hypothetical protein [Scleromatobacter humisilvae]